MGRDGITFEQVAEAAESLVAIGERPTQLAVRARLGTGSLGTIQRHLGQWRAAQPLAAASAAPLPAVIARAFQNELARAVAEARQELEQRLSVAQQEAEQLARDSEAVQAELDASRAELRAVTSERDALSARVTDFESELEHAGCDLDRERAAAASAHAQATELRLANEELRSKLDERSREVATLRTEVREGHETRLALERALGAQQATNVGLSEQIEERKAREDALSSALAQARERNEHLSERDRLSAAELARRETELLARSEQLEACSQTLQASQMREDALRAQLDSSASRERELVRELSRTQAAFEALQQAQESTLERARLKWELEQRGKRGDKS